MGFERHVPEPLTCPVMTWSHSNAANIDDWKVFIQNDDSDIMQGFTVYDSRAEPALFDLQTFRSSHERFFDQSKIVGLFSEQQHARPRSTSSLFHIPHDIGNEINNTLGYINVSEGGFLPITTNRPVS